MPNLLTAIIIKNQIENYIEKGFLMSEALRDAIKIGISLDNFISLVSSESKKSEFEIKGTNENNETLLYLAAFNGRSEICSWLLKKHADLLVISSADNYNPVMAAVLSGDEATVDVFLKYINERNQKATDENPKADILLATNNTQETILHMAVIQPNKDIVKLILKDEQSKKNLLNMQDELGDTVLHKAVDIQDLELIKLFCDAGADLSLQDAEEQTPYDRAIMQSKSESPPKVEMIRYLFFQQFSMKVVQIQDEYISVVAQCKRFKDQVVNNKWRASKNVMEDSLLILDMQRLSLKHMAEFVSPRATLDIDDATYKELHISNMAYKEFCALCIEVFCFYELMDTIVSLWFPEINTKEHKADFSVCENFRNQYLGKNNVEVFLLDKLYDAVEIMFELIIHSSKQGHAVESQRKINTLISVFQRYMQLQNPACHLNFYGCYLLAARMKAFTGDYQAAQEILKQVSINTVLTKDNGLEDKLSKALVVAIIDASCFSLEVMGHLKKLGIVSQHKEFRKSNGFQAKTLKDDVKNVIVLGVINACHVEWTASEVKSISEAFKAYLKPAINQLTAFKIGGSEISDHSITLLKSNILKIEEVLVSLIKLFENRKSQLLVRTKKHSDPFDEFILIDLFELFIGIYDALFSIYKWCKTNQVQIVNLEGLNKDLAIEEERAKQEKSASQAKLKELTLKTPSKLDKKHLPSKKTVSRKNSETEGEQEEAVQTLQEKTVQAENASVSTSANVTSVTHAKEDKASETKNTLVASIASPPSCDAEAASSTSFKDVTNALNAQIAAAPLSPSKSIYGSKPPAEKKTIGVRKEKSGIPKRSFIGGEKYRRQPHYVSSNSATTSKMQQHNPPPNNATNNGTILKKVKTDLEEVKCESTSALPASSQSSINSPSSISSSSVPVSEAVSVNSSTQTAIVPGIFQQPTSYAPGPTLAQQPPLQYNYHYDQFPMTAYSPVQPSLMPQMHQAMFLYQMNQREQTIFGDVNAYMSRWEYSQAFDCITKLIDFMRKCNDFFGLARAYEKRAEIWRHLPSRNQNQAFLSNNVDMCLEDLNDAVEYYAKVLSVQACCHLWPLANQYKKTIEENKIPACKKDILPPANSHK